jgi:hypothetical protein
MPLTLLALLALTACAGCKEEKEPEEWPPYLMDIEFEVTFRDSFTKQPIPNMVVGYGPLKSIADPFSTPEQILQTDINGKVMGRDTMSIFQGLGFEAPLMRTINGFDNLTNEGWAKIIEKLKTGEFSHVANQFRYLAFSENALVDSNRNDNYVKYKKDVFIDPNGKVNVKADWLAYGYQVMVYVVEFDTLLSGPIGYPDGITKPLYTEVYLPANKTVKIKFYMRNTSLKTNTFISDTTWTIKKDSLYEYGRILDTTAVYKSLYQLTIKKPNHIQP